MTSCVQCLMTRTDAGPFCTETMTAEEFVACIVLKVILPQRLSSMRSFEFAHFI